MSTVVIGLLAWWIGAAMGFVFMCFFVVNKIASHRDALPDQAQDSRASLTRA